MIFTSILAKANIVVKTYCLGLDLGSAYYQLCDPRLVSLPLWNGLIGVFKYSNGDRDRAPVLTEPLGGFSGLPSVKQ